MADQPFRSDGRIGVPQQRNHRCQPPILRVGIGQGVGSFQFDADAEIIAALAAGESGLTGVPGAPLQGHILHQFARAPDEQMRGDLKRLNLLKERMDGRIQGIGKQGIDPGSAEFSRRQTDAMDDDQIDRHAGGTVVTVRRERLTCARHQAGGDIEFHGRGRIRQWSRLLWGRLTGGFR